MPHQPVQITEGERDELLQRHRSRSGRADDARVARVILLLADGATYAEIREKLDCTDPFISK